MENYDEFELNNQKYKVTYEKSGIFVWAITYVNSGKSTWRLYPNGFLGNSEPCKYNVKF